MKLGLVGTISGPVGTTTIGYVHATQAWVKWVNARQGLNGHPVALFVADDGADPARHRALVQELVEQRGVIALVNNPEPLTGGPSVEYLASKRIPVIGNALAETWSYDTPFYFPQGSAAERWIDGFYGSLAQQSHDREKRKLGVISCTEATVCQAIADQADDQARRRDLDLVFSARASLAQPDFTAECLAARNAGAEIILIAADSNTVRRVAGSCARQNYRPLFATGSQAAAENMKTDPNLDNRLMANSSTFAYMQANTPATAEYHSILKAGGVPSAGTTSNAYVSMKILEKAASHLSEPPTNESLLRGLYTIKNDDFEGLTAPLTFTEGKPATKVTCWFNIAVINGSWASPDNYRRTCDES